MSALLAEPLLRGLRGHTECVADPLPGGPVATRVADDLAQPHLGVPGEGAVLGNDSQRRRHLEAGQVISYGVVDAFEVQAGSVRHASRLLDALAHVKGS